ncbi:YqaA family protein [Aureimonas frigidaquae]|uniref:YqaA family protein n=1 Tax=Aureimonas frigidaquae TaxID=424757 RepID=UPI000783A6AF|nr:YqaA family protein [Aureimonas frigidaquae]
MIRALYDWTMRLAARPRAAYALGTVSFAESSFFPIPPDVLLIPMVIAERRRAWRLAFICTAASVLGAMLGYAIGAFVFEELALPILSVYGYADEFEAFAEAYNEWGAWIVLIAGGLTPLPFKVVTLASGATGMNIWVFLAAAIVARSSRFYTVAALLYWFGPPVRDFIEKRLTLVFTLGVVAVLGGFLAIRFLH